ncbi:MAG: pantetheine-phosphate adenylyltransferase [Desulfovibrio sp.]|uniref:pantetheine-phosphate adenylyltransferase n=1 Tax=Desulfovibrio sp. 7SRBS1 TaxID=3378064 RepID=UPI003B3D881F
MGKPQDCIAIYPGTFDPLTNGHVSLARRGVQVFKKVVVGVANDTSKKTLFSLEERVAMANEVFANDRNITAEGFSGLLVDYAQRRGATVILRGLRAVSDFEYEFQMALMNRKLSKDIQTTFLMTDFKWMYLSSTIIKEVAKHGGNIKGMVPEAVVPKLYGRFAELQKENI